MKVAIISSSVRIERNTHKVATYFKNYILENKLSEVDLIDLKAYNFPIFDERLRFMKDPSAAILEFTSRITSADGVLIVSPEYNGGYPAALKNVIDLLYKEWKRKPIALATVSDGPFGGTQVMTSLMFTMWKIGALLVPAMFPVRNAGDDYDEQGNAVNKERTDKRAGKFLGELYWLMDRVRS